MDPSHPVTKPLAWRSLQTRVTLLTLCVLVVCIWSLYAYVSRQLHDDIERMVGEQQQATVALHASEINRSLFERMVTLEKVTQLFAPVMTASPGELQTLMNERPALPGMFNGGFFITDAQGTAIASIPLDATRVGMNYLELDHVSSVLKDGKSKISKPTLGKALNSPVVSIAVAIRDAQGKILGALVGVIDLARPNFMDAIMSARYGKSGGYILIAKQWRQVVTATNRDRVLQQLPAPSVNPDIDRYLKDFEGTSVLFDPQGVQVMASAASVRVADWVLVAALPVDEAFAPVHNLNRNMAMAALVASLLAGALIWWLLRHQLVPLHTAFRALKAQALSADPLTPLPKVHDDEIGLLIDGFNRLLLDLNGREADLAHSQLQMRGLLDSLRDAQRVAQLGNWTLNLSNGALHWSDEIFRIFEIDPTQFGATYEAFLNVIHPEDRDRVNQAFSDSLVTRLPYQIQHRLRMPDGRIKWVDERCRSEFDAAGKALRAVGTVQDITDQKLAEAALADARDLLMTVIDLIPMRVFWKDTELRYLGCNTVFAQDAGLQHPSELIGKDDYNMGWAAQADAYRADDRSVIDEGRIKLFFDEAQTTPDGRTIFLRTSKMPLRNQSGALIGVLGVYEDVTQRKAAEMQVRQLSLIVEQSNESILITDLDGNIQYVNQTFEHTTGYVRAEVIGRNPRLLSSGRTSSKTYEALWYALKNGQSWTGELINRRKDASVYVDRALITPLRDQDGTVSCYVSVQRDITEEKSIAQELDNYRHSLEAQVAQRTGELTRARLLADEANRAKSEFLANMSHEIRTPMNGVVGMVEVLRQTGLDASQMRMLETISHSSMALLALLNDILDFSKIEAGKLEIEQVPTPLREIVEEVVLLMLHQALHKNVELSLFVDPTLPRWVLSDPTRLRQILLNLLGNALKLCPPAWARWRFMCNRLCAPTAVPGLH
ncbi:MAG: PAS domain S-box protein [Comamonadaceae bacterium]|nr:PAS domain S-box protein [Comamonadaceae bacterium]